MNFSTLRSGMLSLENLVLRIIRYPFFTVISQINTLETMQVLVFNAGNNVHIRMNYKIQRRHPNFSLHFECENILHLFVAGTAISFRDD